MRSEDQIAVHIQIPRQRWTAVDQPTHYPAHMKITGARWFQRREDYQPPTTISDSPFRHFNVNCLKCGSVKLRVIAEHAEDDADVKVYLFCPGCRSRELLPVRQ